MAMAPQPGVVTGWTPQGLRSATAATGSGSSGARMSLGSPVKMTTGMHKVPTCIVENDTCSAATSSSSRASRKTIVGLGDPVMDMLVHVDAQKLDDLGLATGGCVPVSEEQMAALIQALKATAGRPRYTRV